MSDFQRAFHSYKSVINGDNPVISVSTHEYKKFKSAIIVGSALIPVLLKNEVYKTAIRITKSNRKAAVIPVSAGLFSVGIPLCGLVGWSAVQAWTLIKRMYFATYLGTICYFIDDPNHRIYRSSRIMRNLF